MKSADSVFVVDNFFDDPISIRNIALSRNYNPCPMNGDYIFSGYRSKIQNQNIILELKEKLKNKFNIKNIHISTSFHLNPKISMHGFPHIDTESPLNFAGVIYLNEDIPIKNCGTTIFNDLPEGNYIEKYIENYRHKMEIVYNLMMHPKNYFKMKFSQECLEFKKTKLNPLLNIENVFNRLVCYPANFLHSPDFYFGNSKETSRLTVVFHGTLDAN